MEKIELKIRKSKNGPLLKGPFFVKELDFEEVKEYFDKVIGKNLGDEEEKTRLVQMTLVDKAGNNIFKPQQVNVIKTRMGGIQIMKASYLATKVNDMTSFAEFIQEYEKNSESDQSTD